METSSASLKCTTQTRKRRLNDLGSNQLINALRDSLANQRFKQVAENSDYEDWLLF
ncbi:MAG: hypothetical protein MI864_00035 [Pseudomonadales bacterium]|uniref:Uncharacterized protein n=1 Tax=Oleiphilus messinensis TaxID=141451 RepID=A0A1Y0IEQ1_9GAMM|nr:hypothetical protein [Oleiphilus messinensis]ARU57853.1 hypothetical protein OLMES_3833 [Oleiphilus messinensis]MCG8608897.1 hypothetical protein [Pseudomonadales bacterium]